MKVNFKERRNKVQTKFSKALNKRTFAAKRTMGFPFRAKL